MRDAGGEPCVLPMQATLEEDRSMFSSTLTKFAAVAFAATVLAGSAGTAFADTPWQESHPRREEVNNRLANQDHRINEERREGELGRGQARALHREDHRIRQEERRRTAGKIAACSGNDRWKDYRPIWRLT